MRKIAEQFACHLIGGIINAVSAAASSAAAARQGAKNRQNALQTAGMEAQGRMAARPAPPVPEPYGGSPSGPGSGRDLANAFGDPNGPTQGQHLDSMALGDMTPSDSIQNREEDKYGLTNQPPPEIPGATPTGSAFQDRASMRAQAIGGFGTALGSVGKAAVANQQDNGIKAKAAQGVEDVNAMKTDPTTTTASGDKKSSTNDYQQYAQTAAQLAGAAQGLFGGQHMGASPLPNAGGNTFQPTATQFMVGRRNPAYGGL